MRTIKLILPLLFVLVILASTLTNFYKAIGILSVSLLFFWPLSKKEIYLFIFCSLFFVINDIGAIQNNFFSFTKPDYLGLPFWEFIAWGFWILYSYRILPKEFPKNVDLKTLFLAVIFAQSFMIFQDKISILVASSCVLFISIIFFHSIIDLIYLSFFTILGISVELTGIYFNLWVYPESNAIISHLQFVLMWAGVGLYFRHLIGPFLLDRKCNTTIIRNFFFNNSSIDTVENNQIQGHLGIPQSFENLIKIAERTLTEGNARKLIESLREAIGSAQNPIDKARAHLYLARNYRMLVQMRNAKLELEAAFNELQLDVPRSYTLQTLKYGIIFFYHFFLSKKNTSPDAIDELTKLKVALYEEVGLSGYYLRQDLLMLQASFLAYPAARKYPNSIEYINWLGGTMVVLVLKGFTKKHLKIKEQALKIVTKSEDPFIIYKWKIWEALAFDYLGDSEKSANAFEQIIINRQYLKPEDLRLSALTLSLNYNLRGHFEKAVQTLECLFESAQDEFITYLSRTRTYVDWYTIGAKGILSDIPTDHEMFRSSNAVFNNTDEEKWSISQYLGNLILYYYFNQKIDKDLINSLEQRFWVLKLRPATTYLESTLFWIVICLIKMDGYSLKLFSKEEVFLAVKNVRQLKAHPTVDQFKNIIEDRFRILINGKLETSQCQDFEKRALATNNVFSLFEYYKNNLILDSQNHPGRKSEDHQKIESIILSNGWKNFPINHELFGAFR